MSKITVTTIAGLTSGGDANKVKIESGDTLEVVNGSQTINRTGDGTTLTLQAGGTTFGTIGQDGSDLVIDGPSGHTGLRMTTSGLLPRQNGAIIDNTIDLGSGAYRYNDLYLGGGLYVGGTGAANHLDDYEEGTWTPVVRGSSSAGTYTTTTTYAKYRKVGNIVHISAYLGNITQSSAGSGYLQITGTPFQKPANQYFAGTVWMNQFNVASTARSFVLEPITFANATSTFYIHVGHDNTSASNLQLSELVSGSSDLGISATYFTE